MSKEPVKMPMEEFLETHHKLMQELKSVQACELWWTYQGRDHANSIDAALAKPNTPKLFPDLYTSFLGQQNLLNKRYGLNPTLNGKL